MAIFLGMSVIGLAILAGYFRQRKNRLLNKMKQLELNQQHAEVEIQQLQTQLENTQKDSLTGLETWTFFESHLQQAIKQSVRYQLTLGMMVVDLDGFKVLNNALGNEVGDALLQETAQRLKGCIRQVDHLTRQIKDRFVILLPQLSKAETAAIVATRMLEAISQPFYINERELYLTAGIGISLFPTDAKEPEELLQYAEQALDLAKKKGKHLYQFYHQELHLKSQRELLLATQLNKETFLNELQLCYQPIMDIQTNKVLCLDIMLYWQHRDYGLIEPRELLIYAESQHKLAMLSDWMLKKACQNLLNWQKAGLPFSLLGLPLSLNQVENTHFIYELTQLLKALKFEPQHLLLEIKENVTVANIEKFEKAMGMLKYVGVKLALVDFDSGSLPLSEFKNLNIDYVKLDMAFVKDIVENPKARLVIKSMLAFTQTLGIKMIVQGVESPQQVAILKELGCRLCQGSLLGASLSEHEVSETFAHRIA